MTNSSIAPVPSNLTVQSGSQTRRMMTPPSPIAKSATSFDPKTDHHQAHLGRSSPNLGASLTAARSFSKYKNRRTTVDGITFDSAKEARRWQELLLLQRAKKIDRLERQVRYPLKVNGELICTYVADFRYLEMDGTYAKRFVVEDVKGVRTAVYRLKKKLMKALNGITILET